MRTVFAAAFCMVVIAGAALAPQAAAEAPLAGESLRKAVSGKVVYLRLSFGVELPIAYRADGTMVGKISAAAATFAGAGSQTDSGRWWIADDQLCQRWRRWLDGSTYCYRLSRQGATVMWRRNDGRSGTARIAG